MNRELTQDECRDQRSLLKILERNKLAEWLGGAEVYEQVTRNIEAMQITGTTDGEDLAELTDEDARERPWVMARDDGCKSWIGPYRLLACPPTAFSCVVLTISRTILFYDQARRATENELIQAGITQ